MKTLRNRKIWLCWKAEIRNGKRTKEPYAASGRKAGTNEPYRAAWVTYAEACKAAEVHGFDGVGLVLTDGLCGIDFDHRPADDPAFQSVVALMETYVEVSPSGDGAHILFYCDSARIPQHNGKLDEKYYCKNPHNGMEIYFGSLTSRYFTFTGNAIHDVPVADRTEQALAFLEQHMLKENFPKEQEDMDIPTIARKAKNGAKFAALFDQGDWSGYGSQSEGDLALCGMLAFYSGGDAAMIDQLFRQSKLYREKWEREDYRRETIKKAIAGCNGEFYHRKQDFPPYIYYDPAAKKLRVSCPLLARYIRENAHYFFVKDSAKGGVMRYFYEDGVYRLYSDDMLKGFIKNLITSFDEKMLKMSDVNEVYSQLVTDLAFVAGDTLNDDENIINFQNGILRLSDMALLPSSPDFRSTIQIPCDWIGSPSPTPVFDKYMADLTEGDGEIEALLLQFIGACLSNIKGWRLKRRCLWPEKEIPENHRSSVWPNCCSEKATMRELI